VEAHEPPGGRTLAAAGELEDDMSVSRAASPRIQEFVPLEELLSPKDLELYAESLVGKFGFLDLEFRPIGPHDGAPELCEPVSTATWGHGGCDACPFRLFPPQTTEARQDVCNAGVRKTVAAVVVKGHVIGYVCGPQLPNADFYQRDLSALADGVRTWLEEKKVSLVGQDPATIAAAVTRAAERLSQRGTLERRLRILRDTRACMVAARDDQDVLDAAGRALQALLGNVNLCCYVLTEQGSLQLITARGPQQEAPPATLGYDQGHVGRVIQSREAFYAPDLQRDQAGFIHVGHESRVRSVFTVPVAWGPDGAPGALQASSRTANYFALADRQAMQAVADIMGLAAVKLALQAEKRKSASRDLRPGTWADLLLDLTATTADSAILILDAKRRLYQGLAEEALRAAGAPSAAVRLYDRWDNVLRFAGCAGVGWTDEAKRAVYRLDDRSAGVYAFNSDHPFYVPDVTGATEFRQLLRLTKSVYVLPLHLRGKGIGVLSVDWPGVNGLLPGAKTDLQRLVGQFESVLAVLETWGENLFRQMEDSLNTKRDLQVLAKGWVDRIRRTFEARGCSLFLKFRGDDRLRLFATTGSMPEHLPEYKPGEGLTGWVAQHRQSLRLPNTDDPTVLRGVSATLKTLQKWSEDIRRDDAHGRLSFLATPMIAGDELLGVIRLTVKEDLTEFTHEEETLLQDIAGRIANSIAAAGWMDHEAHEQRERQLQLDRRIGELARVRKIGLRFAETQDLAKLMREVLEVSLAECRMERGTLRLLNEDKTQLILEAVVNDLPEAVSAAIPKEIDIEEIHQRSLDSEKCTFVADTRDDPLWAAFRNPVGSPGRAYVEEIRSALHVPIRLYGECIGLILLGSRTVRAVPDQVLEVLEIIGASAGVAIDSVRRQQELQQQVRLAAPLAMMGTMLGGFLHAIRNRVNDLSAILGNLSDPNLERSAIKTKTTKMSSELNKLAAVCNDLAHFTRIDPVSITERISLNPLIELSPRDRQQVRVTQRFYEPSPIVTGNPVQIEIAFKMIVQNALEAMPDGGELTVETSPTRAAVSVTFRDTGVGMDAATRQKCLEPFFTTKEARGGTGLGLAVVFGIMTRHGGTVDIESEVGRGSVFTLRFPLGRS
jgi:signal transduction histidine kinase/putative methionine-R-sulfoxide reductase with GAF domain